MGLVWGWVVAGPSGGVCGGVFGCDCGGGEVGSGVGEGRGGGTWAGHGVQRIESSISELLRDIQRGEAVGLGIGGGGHERGAGGVHLLHRGLDGRISGFFVVSSVRGEGECEGEEVGGGFHETEVGGVRCEK